MNSNAINARLRRAVVAGLAAAALATTGIGLAGCAQESSPAADSTAAAEQQNVQQVGPLTITDAWVKATDTMMTGAFGIVENTSDKEVTIQSATATVGNMFELHETIVQSDGSSVMQEKEGGFVIPAGGTLELKPGHDHIMLMKLDAPIVPGDEITITLTFGDGSTADFVVDAKEYTGAMETYAPDGSMGGHGGHGDMDHDEHAGHDEHADHGSEGDK